MRGQNGKAAGKGSVHPVEANSAGFYGVGLQQSIGRAKPKQPQAETTNCSHQQNADSTIGDVSSGVEEALNLHTVGHARSYLDQYQYYPITTVLLVLVLVCVYFGYVGTAASMTGPVGGPPETWMMVYDVSCVDRRMEFWRLGSYSFIHAHLVHLIGNMVMLLMLGAETEAVHGHFSLAFLYAVGAMVGGLSAGTFDPHRAVVGASGGIYTLLGARWANLALNWRSMQLRYLRIALNLSVLLLDLVSFFMTYKESTSYFAHVGGWICGLLLGVLVLTNIELERWEIQLQAACGGMLFAYVTFCLIWWGGTWPPRSPFGTDSPMLCNAP